MNTTQIMSTAPQAGAVQTSATSTVSKPLSAQKAQTADSRGQDDFGSALEKSQGNTAKADDAAKTTDAADAAKAAEDVAGETAVAGKTQKATKGGKAKSADKAQEASSSEEAAAAEASVLSAALAAVAAADATVTVEAGAPETTAAELLKTDTQPAAASLQTLLPQDAGKDAQQTKLLAMLAGQSFATDGQTVTEAPLTGRTDAAAMADTPQQAQVSGTAQLTARANQAQTSLAEAFGPLQGWTASSQTQQTAVQTVQIAQTTQAAQGAAALAQAGMKTGETAEQTVQVSDFADLLGTEVQVDGSAPVQPVTAQDGGSALFQQSPQQQSFAQLPGEEMPQTASAAPEKGQAAESAEPGTSATAAPGLLSFSQTLDATSGATSAAPQAMPQTDYEIPKQIVDQARLIQRGQDTEMVIHLKPEHLGDLTLRVSVGTDGAVNASFHSSNAEVRTIIENSLVQLKQELNNQGIKVDNVGVYAGLADGGLPQGQDQQQAFQQGSQQHRSTRESAAAFEDGQELAAALAAQEGNTATDGVDYRI